MAGRVLSPRENFRRAMERKSPEWVPIFWGGTNSSIVPSFYGRLCGELGVTGYKRPVGDFGTVNLHPRLKERFHSDVELLLLGSPPRAMTEEGYIQDRMWGFLMKDMGDHRAFPDSIAPLRQARTIREIEDHPLWPDPEDPVFWADQGRVARRLHDTGKVILGEASYAGAPFFIYPWLRGLDKWLTDPLSNPDLYRHLAGKITELSLAVLERWLAEVGDYLDVLCFYDDIAMQTGPMVSLDHYRRWILPYERRLTGLAKKMTKAKLSIHCCGSCFDLLDGFLEAGYEILNPVQTTAKKMEAWRLKRDYGDRLAFYGGLDVQRLLPFGTPDQVRAGVRELIETLGQGGGLLFASSHNIQPDTPVENIAAMFDAAHEYGRYPLP